ncbi:MAG: septum site-determining protein MinD [Deltaproteobacteria bacterium]|nr:septum site-determining protein MinD [Deltaproteobacteria bacterium]
MNEGLGKKYGAQVFVVTSGKGGVGKTTSTANLGAGLAIKGKRVLVIDADIGLRNLDVILGLENRIVFNLVDVIRGECKPSQAIIRSKKSSNLYLLPASQTDEKESVKMEDFKQIVDHFRKEFDFILIDSPAGIEHGFKNAISAADEAILVTTPEVTSLRDVDKVIGLISARQLEGRLVINRFDVEMMKRGDMLSVKDIEEILSVQLLGVVPKDDAVIVSANYGEPVVYNPKSRAGQSFLKIAGRLAGEAVELDDWEEEKFWTKVFKMFKFG